MLNSFNFKNKNSYLDFGAIIAAASPYGISSRETETIRIPGRNGSILIDKGYYQNTLIKYNCKLINTEVAISKRLSKINQWLCENMITYDKLSDTYNQNYFRYARLSSAPQYGRVKNIITTEITFDCAPFLYSFSGQKKIILTGKTNIIVNPEQREALPHITLYGNGDTAFNINDIQYNIAAIEGYIEIDCEAATCKKGNINCNNKFRANNGFPKFKKGINSIGVSANISKIEIVPRWCKL